jgi:NAD(P)H-flavin reductase
MPSFSVELVGRTVLSPRVMGLRFRADPPLFHRAGQYVELELGDGARHAFSVASPHDPSAPAYFEIAVQTDTSAQPLLELPIGAALRGLGPRGNLVWQADAPSLFVATGTGLAPLRALIKEQLARGLTLPLVLLFGCRAPDDELWGEELRTLHSAEPAFSLLIVYSRVPAAPNVRTGHVQSHVKSALDRLGASAAGVRAYLCGQPGMVAACAAQLIDWGAPPAHVLGESY